ncbi:MAG: 30S ribosome-binding factor RbfA [Bacteroidota bacterium]
METKRQHKFSKLILKDLADIFEHDYRNGFGEAFVTLTGVEISPDLSMASVYVSVLPMSLNESVMETLEYKKSHIRGELGRKIGKQVRIVPDLRFFLDETEERAAHMDELFRNLDIPQEEESDENNETD